MTRCPWEPPASPLLRPRWGPRARDGVGCLPASCRPDLLPPPAPCDGHRPGFTRKRDLHPLSRSLWHLMQTVNVFLAERGLWTECDLQNVQFGPH